MVHHRGPQAHRHHVRDPGRDHAGARVRRRHHDAGAAGDRLWRERGLPQRPSLRPGLHRARDDHDLLRGHSAGHGHHQLRHAAADRRARRCLSLPQQPRLLADGRGCGAGDGLLVHRRVLDRRVAQLRAGRQPAEQSGRGSRLLPLGAADSGRGDDAISHQHGRDHHQDARARHDHDEDAGVLLDRAVQQRAGDRHFPGADRRLRDADARPLRGDELLHQRPRRQPDDVLEPGVDLGPP